MPGQLMLEYLKKVKNIRRKISRARNFADLNRRQREAANLSAEFGVVEQLINAAEAATCLSRFVKEKISTRRTLRRSYRLEHWLETVARRGKSKSKPVS